MFAVTYRNRKTDQSKSREFQTERAAMKWAREFVVESYRDEAAAVVFEGGNCMNLARYDNVNGRAVKTEG